MCYTNTWGADSLSLVCSVSNSVSFHMRSLFSLAVIFLQARLMSYFFSLAIEPPSTPAISVMPLGVRLCPSCNSRSTRVCLSCRRAVSWYLLLRERSTMRDSFAPLIAEEEDWRRLDKTHLNVFLPPTIPEEPRMLPTPRWALRSNVAMIVLRLPLLSLRSSITTNSRWQMVLPISINISFALAMLPSMNACIRFVLLLPC